MFADRSSPRGDLAHLPPATAERMSTVQPWFYVEQRDVESRPARVHAALEEDLEDLMLNRKRRTLATARPASSISIDLAELRSISEAPPLIMKCVALILRYGKTKQTRTLVWNDLSKAYLQSLAIDAFQLGKPSYLVAYDIKSYAVDFSNVCDTMKAAIEDGDPSKMQESCLPAQGCRSARGGAHCIGDKGFLRKACAGQRSRPSSSGSRAASHHQGARSCSLLHRLVARSCFCLVRCNKALSFVLQPLPAATEVVRKMLDQWGSRDALFGLTEQPELLVTSITEGVQSMVDNHSDEMLKRVITK